MEEKEIKKILFNALIDFKEWSIPYLVKVMASINEFGEDPISLGSGGLLKYKNRYFVLTNSHVVKRINDFKKEAIIPYTLDDKKSFKMEIIKGIRDSQKDIAILEVEFSEDIIKSNHQFLEHENVMYDIKSFTEKSNVVFIQGFPSYATSIDNNVKEIMAETLPCCTVVESFNGDDNALYLHMDQENIDENGSAINIDHFGGMSGSFAYGFSHKEQPQFRCLGVLTDWYGSENLLVVYPMNEFIDFIEENFF